MPMVPDETTKLLYSGLILKSRESSGSKGWKR